MTDPVDLLNRAAIRLRDLADEAVDRFEQIHGEQQRDKWLPWMGAQAGPYAGLISHPTIGYALVDELQRTAARAAARIPAWRDAYDRKLDTWQIWRDAGINPDAPRPAPVEDLIECHYGSMLDIARTILGDNARHD